MARKLKSIKEWAGLLMVILSIMGLVTFSLFILEESAQTVMFGIWPAQDGGDWNLVVQGTELMENIRTWINTINYSVGWIQPLAFVAYMKYAEATDFYIRGVREKALAHCPDCFEGKEVSVDLIPQWAEEMDGRWKVTAGPFKIWRDHFDFSMKSGMRITGTVRRIGDEIFIIEKEA